MGVAGLWHETAWLADLWRETKSATDDKQTMK
jgi:hypothetical protein